MVDRIRGISITGRCFSNQTSLLFFPEESNRISIVYGKNGSGKSTISEGLATLAAPSIPSDIAVRLLDGNNCSFLPTNPEKIFVFNEKYIDDNVKINDDGLGTIILLGGQVDIQEEINRNEELFKQAEERLNLAEKEYSKYEDSDDILSPNYHYRHIQTILKQNGGWAEVDSKIKGNRRNSSVTDEILVEICKLKPTANLNDLKDQFSQKWELLSKASNATVNYPTRVPNIHFSSGFEKRICELLAKKIDEPILTEREKQILLVIQNGHQNLVEAARKTFGTKREQICPYCFQHVDANYRENLLHSINLVLNKEVDDHTAELNSVAFPEISYDYSHFSSLDANLVAEISTLQVKCGTIIRSYKKELARKLSNVYYPLFIDPFGLENCLIKLNKHLEKLENLRGEFNAAVKRKKILTEELIHLNKQIAHFQIEAEYKEYAKQSRIQKTKRAALEEFRQEARRLSSHLQDLQQRKSDVGLAINNINNALDYIFFTKGRLSIELRNNKYYLKSNGIDVHPHNISLGERNIIALCYFFTQIVSNQEVSQLYKSEEFIIIDDPISSFDFENRVGITSFIRYQMDRIIQGNSNSKILILSHDLTTVFDLQKAAKEVCDKTKGIAGVSPITYTPCELSSRCVKRFSKSRSEYYELLQTIYRYANGDTAGDSFTIGNTMRRALESFSTFTYRKGIEDVSCDSNVLSALGNHSVYYENLMYRLVLHGESHYEEQVYSLRDDVNFYQFLSENEKRRTAKDILCFMYFLNPYHIDAYFKQTSHAIQNIKNWAKNIPENTSFQVKIIPFKKRVKLYDTPISAGIGNTLDDFASYEEFETSNKECDFALRIAGHSMEPQIADGSIVLLKSCNVVPEGKIGAFYYNGEVFCKKISTKEDGVYLISLNPDYAPIKIASENAFCIYGQVIDVVFP